MKTPITTKTILTLGRALCLLLLPCLCQAQSQTIAGAYNFTGSFQLSKYRNNAAGDSVLTTDTLGRLKMIISHAGGGNVSVSDSVGLATGQVATGTGTGNPLAGHSDFVYTSGRVGVGTQTPVYKLQVNGTSAMGFTYGSSYFTSETDSNFFGLHKQASLNTAYDTVTNEAWLSGVTNMGGATVGQLQYIRNTVHPDSGIAGVYTLASGSNSSVHLNNQQAGNNQYIDLANGETNLYCSADNNNSRIKVLASGHGNTLTVSGANAGQYYRGALFDINNHSAVLGSDNNNNTLLVVNDSAQQVTVSNKGNTYLQIAPTQSGIAIGDISNYSGGAKMEMDTAFRFTTFNGKVGIGLSNPDTTLHIAGSIKIVDGTQGTGKVLTSDADGLASWGNIATVSPPYNGIQYNKSGAFYTDAMFTRNTETNETLIMRVYDDIPKGFQTSENILGAGPSGSAIFQGDGGTGLFGVGIVDIHDTKGVSSSISYFDPTNGILNCHTANASHIEMFTANPTIKVGFEVEDNKCEWTDYTHDIKNSLPFSYGSFGNVLTTDGAGTITWQMPFLVNISGQIIDNGTIGTYADDAAAASGGVNVGSYYINATTGALTKRLL